MLSRDSDKMDPRSINNDMAVRALNYHGQQLTSFLKDEPMFMHLDLRNVDYHMYQVLTLPEIFKITSHTFNYMHTPS